MADYSAQIRLAVQGLPQLDQLERRLESAVDLLGRLQQGSFNVGQAAQSAERRTGAAALRRRAAGLDLARAQRTVENVAMRLDPATGRIMGGGPNATARRLAGAQLRLAQREVRESGRALREEEQNRRLILAAQQRYARALDRAGNVIGGIQGSVAGQQAALNQAMQGIGRGSYGNLLTNRYRGRQAEFLRGGGGRELSEELQQQARNVRKAWDIATAGGRENLPLMRRLSAEMAGLVREQNEFNRARSGRSIGFEAARRGQERIDELAARPGASQSRIARLRSQAEAVITADSRGDVAGSRDATRRMKASIMRYTRELDAAAQELNQQRRVQFRNFGVRQSWRTALEEGAQIVAQNRRALPSSALLAQRIAATPGGVAPTRLDELKKREEKAAAEEAKKAERERGRYFKKLQEEEKRRASLGIGASAPERIGGPRRRVSAVAMGGGVDSGIMPRALPSSKMLAERIALSGQRQPTRLDELKAQEEKRLAEETKRAAGSVKRFADAVEREAKRQASLGIGVPERVGGSTGRSRAGAIPMGGGIDYEAEAAARQAILARVQKNIELSQASREASNFGFGSADDAVAKSIRRNREKTARATAREAAAAAKSANQADAAARATEFRRTGGLSFEERLARIRPDLAPGAAKPAPGFFRGSPRKAIGEGLIGGAFPLLFGQGAGASIGGAVGGGFGGAIGGSFGFGLSLAGTAIGQAVDNTAANLKDLAAALKSPNEAMAALEASGFRVSDSLKFQVEQLQSVGRAYDAQTLVLQEVQKRLGPGSLTELRQLDSAQKRLQEQYAAIGAEIQVRLLPVLQGFVEFLGVAAEDIGGFASQSRLQRLDSAKFEKLRTQAIRETARGPFGSFGDKAAFDARLNELTRQELSRRFAGERAQIPRSPQEAAADETTRIQESRRIADQIQSAYREAFNLQRQAHDLQREGAEINKEIADYSYRKQREIFDLRQQVAEKEIENNRAAAQNRIERSDLGARQTFAAAVGFEQQLLTNVRETVRTRKEGEADIEQSRKRLELTMAKLNRDVEDYKRTNAREIQDIERRKLAYVRSVEDYKMRVADYVRDRSREAADFMRQAMAQGQVGGSGAIGGSAPYVAVSPTQRIPFMSEIDRAAREANVDPRLFAGLVKQESSFRPGARSDTGAIGLAQLMPGTARELGVDPFNIQENLRGGAKYLRQMIDRFGLEGGLRAYNQGPGAQQRTPAGNSQQSREYPGKVLTNARAFGFNPAAMPPPATMGGAIGLTGATGIGTGAHLDVRWADGRPITSADADRFIRVAGRVPSSFGVTSGYGPRRAPVAGASTFHKGVDFGTPAGQPITLTGGARLIGSMAEAQSGGGGIVGIIDTPMGQMKLLHLEKVLGSNVQAMAAGQISNIPVPQFNPTPVGPTPSAAPVNAERMAVLTRATGNERDAQRILENEIKLRKSGVKIGQLEQILQSNQLPQLKQQGDEIRRQTEARRQSLALSDQDASIADIKAEGEARIVQLLADRRSALQSVQKQYPKDVELLKLVNFQSAKAIEIAYGEEQQRLKNAKAINALQNEEASRTEILRLQLDLSVEKAEATALERGELQASNIELFRATALYEVLTDQQKQMAEGLIAQTEELRKQNEFRRRIAELDRDTSLIGAGLRTGRIGADARAFEQGLRDFDGDIGKASEYADRTKLQEDRRMVWESLEKNIIDVSDAISGSLTNGLLDIISGAREIEDVGRDMLNGIARTFADSAQQQLTVLMQRQLAGVLGGPQGPLVKALGGGGGEALGAASAAASGSLWGLNGAAIALGATMQTVAAQMALSGAMGGVGSAFSSSAPSLLGSVMPSLVPGFSPTFTFGGFLAEGGTTSPNKGYVVGEKEPEFFFPGRVGRVVPKSDMEKAAALQSDSATNMTIDMRYTVVEERGERYVTEDQFRKGLAETQRRTQAMTYAKMRTSKDVRDYVNI